MKNILKLAYSSLGVLILIFTFLILPNTFGVGTFSRGEYYEDSYYSNQEYSEPETIICSKNIYDCTNERRIVNIYQYCLEETGSDIHNLDADKDGIPCEANRVGYLSRIQNAYLDFIKEYEIKSILGFLFIAILVNRIPSIMIFAAIIMPIILLMWWLLRGLVKKIKLNNLHVKLDIIGDSINYVYHNFTKATIFWMLFQITTIYPMFQAVIKYNISYITILLHLIICIILFAFFGLYKNRYYQGLIQQYKKLLEFQGDIKLAIECGNKDAVRETIKKILTREYYSNELENNYDKGSALLEGFSYGRDIKPFQDEGLFYYHYHEHELICNFIDTKIQENYHNKFNEKFQYSINEVKKDLILENDNLVKKSQERMNEGY